MIEIAYRADGTARRRRECARCQRRFTSLETEVAEPAEIGAPRGVPDEGQEAIQAAIQAWHATFGDEPTFAAQACERAATDPVLAGALRALMGGDPPTPQGLESALRELAGQGWFIQGGSAAP